MKNIRYILFNVIKRSFSNKQLPELHHASPNPDSEAKKLLKIAILGLPNTGKSTLINKLVERPICATSCKVHTTKLKYYAIYNKENTQLAFIDTPGLICKSDIKKFKLGNTFQPSIQNAVEEADVIGIMQDMQVPNARKTISNRILNIVPFAKQNTPFILILNKVDLIRNKSDLLEVVDNLAKCNYMTFSDIFMTSALKNNGVEDLRNYFLDMAKLNKWIYDEDVYTDQKPEEIIERTIQAKLLDNVRHEIPYNLNLKVVFLEFDEARNIRIIVEIKPDKARHTKLIIGSRGRRIRIVALQSEQELCNIFHSNVMLKLIFSN